MKLERYEMAGLKCAALSPEAEGEYPLVVMLHGFGDQGESYLDIGTFISRDKYRYVFPTAPMSVMGVGFGWFPIDANFRDFAKRAATVRPQFNNLLDGLLERYSTPANRTVVGGFSQGGMLTLDGGLRYHDKDGNHLAGLLALSTLLPADDPTTEAELNAALKAAAETKLPIFMAHGANDPVIPPRNGRNSRDMLQKAGANLEFFDFSGFHEITLEELERIKAFLSRVL